MLTLPPTFPPTSTFPETVLTDPLTSPSTRTFPDVVSIEFTDPVILILIVELKEIVETLVSFMKTQSSPMLIVQPSETLISVPSILIVPVPETFLIVHCPAYDNLRICNDFS